MAIEQNFTDVFNSVTNGSEFGIKEFLEMYSQMTKEIPRAIDKKKIQFLFIKLMTAEEIEVIQMRKGSVPYIFKKVCDTTASVADQRMEFLKRRMSNNSKSYYKKHRNRAMEKTPNLTKNPEENIERVVMTKVEYEVIQQQCEVKDQTIANLRRENTSLKTEKTRLLDELQQLTAELRTREAASKLIPANLSWLKMEA